MSNENPSLHPKNALPTRSKKPSAPPSPPTRKPRNHSSPPIIRPGFASELPFALILLGELLCLSTLDLKDLLNDKRIEVKPGWCRVCGGDWRWRYRGKMRKIPPRRAAPGFPATLVRSRPFKVLAPSSLLHSRWRFQLFCRIVCKMASGMTQSNQWFMTNILITILCLRDQKNKFLWKARIAWFPNLFQKNAKHLNSKIYRLQSTEQIYMCIRCDVSSLLKPKDVLRLLSLVNCGRLSIISSDINAITLKIIRNGKYETKFRWFLTFVHLIDDYELTPLYALSFYFNLWYIGFYSCNSVVCRSALNSYCLLVYLFSNLNLFAQLSCLVISQFDKRQIIPHYYSSTMLLTLVLSRLSIFEFSLRMILVVLVDPVCDVMSLALAYNSLSPRVLDKTGQGFGEPSYKAPLVKHISRFSFSGLLLVIFTPKNIINLHQSCRQPPYKQGFDARIPNSFQLMEFNFVIRLKLEAYNIKGQQQDKNNYEYKNKANNFETTKIEEHLMWIAKVENKNLPTLILCFFLLGLLLLLFYGNFRLPIFKRQKMIKGGMLEGNRSKGVNNSFCERTTTVWFDMVVWFLSKPHKYQAGCFDMVMWLRRGDRFYANLQSDHNMNNKYILFNVLCLSNFSAGYKNQENQAIGGRSSKSQDLVLVIHKWHRLWTKAMGILESNKVDFNKNQKVCVSLLLKLRSQCLDRIRIKICSPRDNNSAEVRTIGVWYDLDAKSGDHIHTRLNIISESFITVCRVVYWIAGIRTSEEAVDMQLTNSKFKFDQLNNWNKME